MPRTTRWAGAFLLALFGGVGAASAQEPDVEQHRLSFRAYETLGPGEYSLVEGTTGPTPDEFYAEDLDVLQPVGVVLQARAPDAGLKLELRSYSWTDPLRETTTDETGMAAFRLRTGPDLYVRVVAPDGEEEPYQLAVWKGEPISPAELGRALRPAVVPASEHEGGGEDGAGGGGGPGSPLSSAALWAAMLFGGFLAAGLILRKRGAA